MRKVYLSISKVANEQFIQEVKNLFIKNDFEISFWDSTKHYDPSLLENADIVAVIPGSLFEPDDYENPTIANVMIGKGNFNELNKGLDLKKNVVVFGRFSKDSELLVMTKPFITVKETRENFQVNWGIVTGNCILSNEFFE